jgi:hypothetical protein
MQSPKKNITINCKKNGVFVIYEEITGKNKITSIDNCVNYGISLIQTYLSEWNLRIRPIDKEDIKKIIKSDKLRENLCGDSMEDMLLNAIDDIQDDLENEDTKGTFDFYELNEIIRLTYVLSPIKNNTILGIVSAVIDYRDNALNITMGEFYESKIKKNNTLYIEIGCSSQKHQEFTTGTNYFIRALILLKAFEIKNIRLIWGSASGNIRGEHSKLKEEHIKRKCKFINDTNYYYCDPIEFLNNFFDRIHKKDLLKYTKKYT